MFGNFTNDTADDLFSTGEGDRTLLGDPRPALGEVVLQDMLNIAELVGNHAEANAAELAPCLGSSSVSCVMSFVDDAGQRLYGRPLTDEERAIYSTGLEATISDKGEAAAVGLVARTLATDPNFIYIVEDGEATPNGIRKLTGDEIAVRLAYLLTQSVPDEALLQAAAKGELGTAEQVVAQAERLLQQSSFDPVLDFLMKWSTVTSVTQESTKKDTDLFPHWNPTQTADSIRTQGRAFFEDLLANDQGLTALLTSNALSVNAATAPLVRPRPERFSRDPNRRSARTLRRHHASGGHRTQRQGHFLECRVQRPVGASSIAM